MTLATPRFLALFLVDLCVAPASALAGMAEVAVTRTDFEASKGVRYTASGGERNRLEVLYSPRFAIVTDPEGVSAGEGCRPLSPARPDAVRCAIDLSGSDCSGGAECPPVLLAGLGDRDDTASLAARRGSDLRVLGTVLRGGVGNDVLRGASGRNAYFGGQGDDRMIERFGDGATFDEGRTPNGRDTIVIDAESSQATVDYSGRSASVRADLSKAADDGERREHDNIVVMRALGVTLLGGRGDDRLAGSRDGEDLQGGPGSDVLIGRGGNDSMYAGRFVSSDEPRPTGGRGADTMLGGPGADALYGSDGDNLLVGGPGPDTVYGFGGSDVMPSRDRSGDEIDCGAGADRTRLDQFDFIAFARGSLCERASRPAPATAFVPRGAEAPQDEGPVGDEKSGLVRVACPGDGPLRCRGTVRLLYRGRTMGTGTFSLRRGTVRDVFFRTSRFARRLLLRREGVPVSTVAAVRSRDRFRALRTTRMPGIELAFFEDYGDGGE